MDITNTITILGVVILAFLFWKLNETIKNQNKEKKEDQSMIMLQKQLFEIEKSLKEQDKNINNELNRSKEVLNESLQKQFESSSKMIKDMLDNSKSVSEELTKLGSTNKQIMGFAEQMKSLENILKNPKQRGILGEFFLENLLSQQLAPNTFKMQYSFPNGDIVDAVIFIKKQLIPIDAKFSLENYNRIMEENDEGKRLELEKVFKSDLKKRIDETSKYVKPENGTTDFAFMFIPADGIFYNLLSYTVGGALNVNSQDLIEYAFKKRVILVSPMTFYAYLQTVMQALKALEIEESATQIQKKVGDLGRHLNAYQEYMKRLGNNINTSINTYNNAGKEFRKIDKDVNKITNGEVSIKPELPESEKIENFSDNEN